MKAGRLQKFVIFSILGKTTCYSLLFGGVPPSNVVRPVPSSNVVCPAFLFLTNEVC